MTRRYRPLLANLLLGLFVTLTLWGFSGLAILEDIEDLGIEWLMRLHQLEAPPGARMTFAIIDFDDAAYRAMGEPPYIDWAAIAQALDYVMRHQPRLVIVDFDLSHAGDDVAAAQTLENLVRGTNRDTELIVVKVLRDTDGRIRAVPSFLEQAVADSPTTHWANAYFHRDGGWQVWRADLI